MCGRHSSHFPVQCVCCVLRAQRVTEEEGNSVPGAGHTRGAEDMEWNERMAGRMKGIGGKHANPLKRRECLRLVKLFPHPFTTTTDFPCHSLFLVSRHPQQQQNLTTRKMLGKSTRAAKKGVWVALSVPADREEGLHDYHTLFSPSLSLSSASFQALQPKRRDTARRGKGPSAWTAGREPQVAVEHQQE